MPREVTNIDEAQVGDVLTPAQIVEAATGEKPGIREGLSLKDLEYPLNNTDEYKGRLVFNVMEEPETDLGNVADAAAKMTSSGIEAIKKALGTDNPEEVSKASTTFGGLDNIPIIKDRPLIDTGRRVSLYLPVGLQYRDNVAYDNMDLGGVGASVEQGLKSGTGAISALVDNFKSTISAGLGGAANKEVASLAAVRLTSALPDEISGAFRSAAGVTTNPNTRVLFKSVGLRDFSFAFKFIATSSAEAEEIKEIIKLFRTELYPENINLPLPGGSSVSIGYRFPNKFQITVEYDGEEVATRIKPCYLRDVTVTYNTTAMSMHSDGNFQEIEMTLAFQESRTLNRKDVEEDGF